MKKVYFVLVFAFFAFLIQESNAQTTIWSEDFPYADGTIIGPGTPAKWTRDISGCNFGNNDHFEVRNNRMQGRDTDGEAIWYSETIDISAYSNVAISAVLSENGNSDPFDYIRIYYSLDGGTETLFANNGDNFGLFDKVTASQTGLNGNNVIIIVRLNNNDNNNRHRFDNVIVFEPIPGDFCSDAIAVGEITDLPFSTLNATRSGEIPYCGNNAPFDIWYAYTPSASGIAMFDLCGSNFRTRLAIWDACGGTVLDCNEDNGPACSGQQSSIEMAVVAGTTYYVQVGGRNAQQQGDGDISIALWPYPTNDDCANAIAIGEVTDMPFSTVAATASGADPGCGGNQPPIDI
jgi:hypothetical protein